MDTRRVRVRYVFIAIAITAVNILPAYAAYVTPRIGGDQRKHDVAPMIMPEITFDGTNIAVLDEMGNPWVTLTGQARPILWPLEGTDEFEPGKPWYNALNGKAYNWQYGWSNAALDQGLIPAGSKIWLEVLSQSDGLKTYDRNNYYVPIFGTDGASNKWRWYESMSMSHNAYTVAPSIGEWFATYKVYIGDATTGAALAGYGSDTVTLTWTSIPEPTTIAILGIGAVCLLHKKYRRERR